MESRDSLISSLEEVFRPSVLNSISYEELIDISEAVMAISNHTSKINRDDISVIDLFVKDILLPKFIEQHLKNKDEWYNKNNKYLIKVVNQLLAIAYLTGHVSPFLSDPLAKVYYKDEILKYYVTHNYLHRSNNTKPIIFINFNRARLTLELVLRVIDTKLIQQGDTELCGPTSFFQMYAQSSPIQYIEYVMGLSENGEHTLGLDDNHPGTLVKVLTPSLFERQSWVTVTEEESVNPIHDADHIALNVFRDNRNLLISYTNNQDQFTKQMFGVTFSKEIETWMFNSGFENVHRKIIYSSDDIITCSRQLKYGYSIILLSTVPMTDRIIHNLPVTDFEKLTQLLRGHFFQVASMTYDKKSDMVSLSIVSWGKNAIDFKMPFSEFLAIKGFGKFIIGRSKQAKDQLRGLARTHSYQNRMSPYEYCCRLESTLKSKDFMTDNAFNPEIPLEIKEILSIIEKDKITTSEDSWTSIAKKIQGRLFEIYYDSKEGLDFPILRGYLPPIAVIIPEETIQASNKLLQSIFTNPRLLSNLNINDFKPEINEDELVRRLEKCIFEYDDLNAFKLLTDYYFFKKNYSGSYTLLVNASINLNLFPHEKETLEIFFIEASIRKILSLFGEKSIDPKVLIELRSYVDFLTPPYTIRSHCLYLCDLLLNLVVNGDNSLLDKYRVDLRFPITLIAEDILRSDSEIAIVRSLKKIIDCADWKYAIDAIKNFKPTNYDIRELLIKMNSFHIIYDYQLAGLKFFSNSNSPTILISELNHIDELIRGHRHTGLVKKVIINNIKEIFEKLPADKRKEFYEATYHHPCFTAYSLPITRGVINRLFSTSQKDAIETTSQQQLREYYENASKSLNLSPLS